MWLYLSSALLEVGSRPATFYEVDYWRKRAEPEEILIDLPELFVMQRRETRGFWIWWRV